MTLSKKLETTSLAGHFVSLLDSEEMIINQCTHRAPDKMHIFISVMPIASPNPMFDHLLESSH